MRLHYLQHVPYEPPGAIADWARDRGHTVEGTHLYEGDPLPRTDEFDWLVVMGGPMGAYDEDEYPWLADEKALVRDALGDGKTVLGVCLGAQILADSVGGRVYKHDETEIGWYPVEFGDAPPPLSALPDRFDALHWHGDTYGLPGGVDDAATTPGCDAQAFVFRAEDGDGGTAVGLQFHLESTEETARALVENSTPLPDGRYVQGPEEILSGDFDDLNRRAYDLLDSLERMRGDTTPRSQE